MLDPPGIPLLVSSCHDRFPAPSVVNTYPTLPPVIVRLPTAPKLVFPVTSKFAIVAVDVLLDTVITLLKTLWLSVDIVRIDPLAPVPRFGSAWLSPKN